MTANILRDGLDTRPIFMETLFLVAFQAPAEDVDRIFGKITEVAPLAHGKTDRNGFRTPAVSSTAGLARERRPEPRTRSAKAPASTRCASSCHATPPRSTG